jgi:hypothetical protein
MFAPIAALVQAKRGTLTRFALLCALLIAPCVSHAQTAEIHIRIVNGKNGRPIKNETLRVWTTRDHIDADLWPTDANGAILLKVDGAAQIALDENLNASCRTLPANQQSFQLLYSVAEVLNKGISTDNTCGTARVTAKPGELILFERPFTLMEKVKGVPANSN